MFSKTIKKIVALASATLFVISTCIGCTNTSQKTTQKKSDTIKIATKPMTEEFILAEMIRILIEDETDLNVEITKGIGGGTSNIQPAMEKGEFDLYPEYTGTGWSFVLKEKEIPDDKTLLEGLKKGYKEKYDFSWIGLYGFNNTYGLAIRKDLAEKYNIKTYSDLKKYAPELIFGAEYDFYERDDGYDALCDKYGLKFKKTKDIDIGLKYDAINSKKIDIMNIFTTDGQLSVSDVTMLKDDKHFYNTYYCSTVVRNEVLKEHPELEDVLMKMDNIINEEEMQKLNYEVEGENKEDKDVAMEFLKEKGLIK